MNFIKKIFENEVDEKVHVQFQKFSKGEFRNKAVIKAKRTKEKYTINTTYEFANEIVKIVAEKLADSKTKVTGVIISTQDLSGELEFKNKKQFQGVKKYIIEQEMSGNEISDILKKFPKAFFALSFKSDDTEIKIKPKMPKSGKPSKKAGEIPKPDFCKLMTTDEKLGKSFVFEKPDFKEAEISHDFIIKELILPKGENDYSKIREMAKRKGAIIRKANIDGKKTTSEKEFEA